MIELGSPLLYLAAVAWGLAVANVAGIVDLALTHGVDRLWEVGRAD